MKKILFMLLSTLLFLSGCYEDEDKDYYYIHVAEEVQTIFEYGATLPDLTSYFYITDLHGTEVTIDESMIYSNIDINKLGNYYIEVTVKDENNKPYTKKINIYVVDNTSPIINITDSSNIKLYTGSDESIWDDYIEYSDGYNLKEDLTTKTTYFDSSNNEVDFNYVTNNIGTYTVIYEVIDSSNNISSISLEFSSVDPITEYEIILNSNLPTEYNELSTISTNHWYNYFTVLFDNTEIDKYNYDLVDECTTDSVITPLTYNSPSTCNITYTIPVGNHILTRTVVITIIDITSPVITTSDSLPYEFNELDQFNYSWTDYFTVEDNKDGLIIISENDIINNCTINNNFKEYQYYNGNCTITLTIYDTTGNASTSTIDITVNDITPPSIMLNTGLPIIFNENAYIENLDWKEYFIVSDNKDIHISIKDSDITQNCTTNNTFNGVSEYTDNSCTVSLSITDSSQNTSNYELTINIKDITPAVININSSLPIAFNELSTFQYSWSNYFIVTDNNDGNITDLDSMIEDNCTIDNRFKSYVASTGTCSIYIEVVDSSGNITQRSLTITIKDITAPIIYIDETLPRTFDEKTYYQELDWKQYFTSYDNKDLVIDIKDEHITQNCSNNNTFNNVETYSNKICTVTVSITDSSYNTSTESISIEILDITSPTISKLSNEYHFNESFSFNQENWINYVKIQDNYDLSSDITISITDTCLTNNRFLNYEEYDIPGYCTVTYNASDLSGNTTTSILDIYIRDITAPVVSINDSKVTSFNELTRYSDLNWTEYFIVTDNKDIYITVNNSMISQNCTTYSTFTNVELYDNQNCEVSITVSDSSGNIMSKRIYINVKDITSPSIDIIKTLPTTFNENEYYVSLNWLDYFEFEDNLDTIDYGLSYYSTNNCETSKRFHSYQDYSTKGLCEVSIIVSDKSNNISTATIEINVLDITPPTITVSEQLKPSYDEYHNLTSLVDYFTVIDNEYLPIEVNESMITQDCLENGNFLSYIEYSMPGSCTVQIKVSDDFGNISELSIDLSIDDITAPNITIDYSDIKYYYELYEFKTSDIIKYITVMDNKDGSIEVLSSSINNNCSDSVQITTLCTITVTVLDSSGNKSIDTLEYIIVTDQPSITQFSPKIYNRRFVENLTFHHRTLYTQDELSELYVYTAPYITNLLSELSIKYSLLDTVIDNLYRTTQTEHNAYFEIEDCIYNINVESDYNSVTIIIDYNEITQTFKYEYINNSTFITITYHDYEISEVATISEDTLNITKTKYDLGTPIEVTILEFIIIDADNDEMDGNYIYSIKSNGSSYTNVVNFEQRQDGSFITEKLIEKTPSYEIEYLTVHVFDKDNKSVAKYHSFYDVNQDYQRYGIHYDLSNVSGLKSASFYAVVIMGTDMCYSVSTSDVDCETMTDEISRPRELHLHINLLPALDTSIQYAIGKNAFTIEEIDSAYDIEQIGLSASLSGEEMKVQQNKALENYYNAKIQETDIDSIYTFDDIYNLI